MDNTGLCVQIGLNHTAEGLAITHPTDWKSQIPKLREADICSNFLYQLDFTSWKYVGVDADPASIIRMIETHGTSENHQFVQSFLEAETGKLTKGWYNLDYSQEIEPEPYYNFSVSLDDLLTEIRDNQNTETIDLLIIDIDSWEWTVLENFDWSVKPTYICLEVNIIDETCNLSDFCKMFIENGYEEFKRIVIPDGNDFDVYTLQFRLKNREQLES